MSLQFRTKRFVGNAAGFGLLLLGLLSALYGVYTLALILFGGFAASYVVNVMFLFGLALFCLVIGVYVRKAVAGTVLPLDVNTDKWRATMFRGGQG